MKGIVVESTFNWYWIVDGLMEAGYQVHLANTSAMQQYEGLKYIDDTRDSFWLAKMLRLKILPEGYIYPKETRSVRDLLRKRMMLVQQRTAHILSMQTMVNRNKGVPISGDTIKKLSNEEVMGMFSDVHLTMS
ncbi:IS110 family transposase, partial [Escherichia coli]|nr:IS110 family transposase [Escherichia coli]